MTTPRIVSHEEFTLRREQLARQRRGLRWEKVEKNYVFDAPEGKVTLADLFAGKSQLVIQHFMFGLDLNEGAPGCGIDVHRAPQDKMLVLVSCRPIAKLEACRKRMGWTARWVSSLNNDFSLDYGVTFRLDEPGCGPETPGLNNFRKCDDGTIHHACSTPASGIEVRRHGRQ